MADEEQQQGAAAPKRGAPAAEGEAVAVDEAALAKAKKRKMLMIGAAGLAVVGIIIAVLVVVLGGKEETSHEGAATADALVIYDLPQMSVNLLSDDVSQRFLRAKLALELKTPEDIAVAGKMLPRLQDDWQGFLRQMRFEDFRGSAAIDRVKNALLLRARQVAGAAAG